MEKLPSEKLISQFNRNTIFIFPIRKEDAKDHRKDTHPGIRSLIATRLHTLLTVAHAYMVRKKYDCAFNTYVYFVFPEALRLIADIEKAILQKRIKDGEIELEIDVQDHLKATLSPVVTFFYSKMNEQIANLIKALEERKAQGKSCLDPTFIRKQLNIRMAELYRGEFKSKNNIKKKTPYAGENYIILITRVVFTSWKMFLFLRSVEMGEPLIALRECSNFRLEDYLEEDEREEDVNEETEERRQKIIEERKKVEEDMVLDFVEETIVTIRGLNDGSIDKERIEATAEKYNSLTDPTVNYTLWESS